MNAIESVVVRQATVADIPAIVALGQTFLKTTAYGHLLGRVADRSLETVCRLCFEHGAIFIADDEGGALGFIALLGVPHPFTGEGFADEIAWFVEPSARGEQRVGPLLLGAAELWATSRGFGMIKMVAPADHPIVGRYYRRRGYTEAETTYYKRL